MKQSFRAVPVGWRDEDALMGVLGNWTLDSEWLETVRGAGELRVIISDHWLAAASVPWSSAQLTGKKARQDAWEHLNAAGYDVLPDEQICLDDCASRRPRLALAYPSRILTALEHLARESGVRYIQAGSLAVLVGSRLRAMRPRPKTAALAIVEPGDRELRAATFVKLDPACERIERVVPRNIRAECGAEWRGLEQAWMRLGWGGQDEAASHPAPCVVIDANLEGEPLRAATKAAASFWLPVSWTLSQEDSATNRAGWIEWLGLRPGRAVAPLDIRLEHSPKTVSGFRPALLGVPMRSWQVAAIAAVAAATVWLAGEATEHRERLALVRAAEVAALAPRTPVPPLTPQTRERLLAVNHVIAHLNIPVEDVLRAIQPPADIHVGLIGLEASAAGAQRSDGTAGQPLLKVMAEAPSALDMTRYVSYLGGRRPLTRAELLKHEFIKTGNTDAPYRFHVEIGWQP
ncbi:MAG: hypothetical protein NDJ19_00295 [Ramlibacter sp.]|nr:hypothetical protein [Ramlibacter sp.]